MKRFPRHVNFKITSIKFLINNNKSVNLTVCRGLRESYNWCSPFGKGIVCLMPEVDLHRPRFGTRDHHLRERERCCRLPPSEVQSGMHLPICMVFPSSGGCTAPAYVQRKGQGFARMKSVLASVIAS